MKYQFIVDYRTKDRDYSKPDNRRRCVANKTIDASSEHMGRRNIMDHMLARSWQVVSIKLKKEQEA